jgi:hypothetical protein
MMARPFTGVAIDNITDLRAYIRGGNYNNWRPSGFVSVHSPSWVRQPFFQLRRPRHRLRLSYPPLFEAVNLSVSRTIGTPRLSAS